MANHAQAETYSRKLLFLEQLNHIKTEQVTSKMSLITAIPKCPWMVLVQDDSE